MAFKSKLYSNNWEFKRSRLKYHLKTKNINNSPRLVVFRSNKNIFTQLVDDVNNRTILSVSSIDKTLKGDIDKGAEVMQNMMDNLESGGTISEESQGMENPAQAMFDQAQMMEGRLE